MLGKKKTLSPSVVTFWIHNSACVTDLINDTTLGNRPLLKSHSHAHTLQLHKLRGSIEYLHQPPEYYKLGPSHR